MKNIVKFKIIKPSGEMVVDARSNIFYAMSTENAYANMLPYTKLFERIVIRNYTSIPMELLNRLTTQYLHGAEIIVETPTRHFLQSYKVFKPKPFYMYQWTPLDLSAPVPKSLAEFKFKYNDTETTYLDAIKSLKSTRFLPNEIWNALDIYSRQQIDKCRELNRGNYNDAEQWFKDLMKDCYNYNIKVFSPNKKTYFEAMAEISFEKSFEYLDKDEKALSDNELAFLIKFAPAYGVEVPEFMWRINSRKTDHGYTEEPERVYCGMSNDDWNKVIYDPRNENLPSAIRQNLTVRSHTNDKLLLEAYKQLKWLIDNLADEALMPNWKRCPECHQLYREVDGCECGACPPIEFIDANNLFYGDASGYEDYESTHNYYETLVDEYTDIDTDCIM